MVDLRRGNINSLRHGGFSARVISIEAARIMAALLEEFPYLGTKTFEASVERYCREEARARLLHDHVMQVAEEQGPEAVRPYLWTEATRAATSAQHCASECGLSARAHSAIARDLGLAKVELHRSQRESVQRITARGRAVMEARQLRDAEEANGGG